LFRNESGRRAADYIKKKISPKWAHTNTTATNNYAENKLNPRKKKTLVGLGYRHKPHTDESSTQRKKEEKK
jgi:hypothetical protein